MRQDTQRDDQVYEMLIDGAWVDASDWKTSEHAPAVILESGRLIAKAGIPDGAVNGSVAGIFAALGQYCVAGSRPILHEDVANDFMRPHGRDRPRDPHVAAGARRDRPYEPVGCARGQSVRSTVRRGKT